jgi:RNA polymerase sigma factor (TIGR02999 family)
MTPAASDTDDDAKPAREIAELLASAEGGDAAGAGALFTALYSELHRLASRQLARRPPGITMGTTTLLHEAYLGMSDKAGAIFPDRGRFMAYAARAMRGLIIDHVRNRKALKRGGAFELTALEGDVADPGLDHGRLARIGDAIDALAVIDAPLAQVVDLRFFCGFSFVEIAQMRGISERTVQRQWEKARIYLHRTLGHDASV